MSRAFPFFIAFVAATVWVTGETLPAMVAAHFGASGQPDRLVPREVYLRGMEAVVIVMPLLVVYLPNFLIARLGGALNLPNRDYWLARERRPATIAYLRRSSFRFGYLFVAFLAYVHWLVVFANRFSPPQFPLLAFAAGMVVFTAGTIVFILSLLRRFGRFPEGP